ncbi:pilus assembly protein PilM [Vibrio sp. JPW-9-11-11]|uniref:type IV pilus biogenesis protein PilM n=1 Tax=Vibrio sp. JPW-9-11-11 TaxID=1416532 RepID=UPI001594CB2C|nr:pilus assembly protein PilM [Vibrio sp. JPW-9-11-11]NVD05448.1 pilus assembly protein PilM [Vibrio sp. JPW-9-11-11]
MGNSLVTGLDIGRHSIKAVVIKPSKDAFALVSYRTLPIETGILSDNHGLNYQKIVKKLKELRKSLPLFSRKVAFAITDNSVITKVIQIDSRFTGYERELAIEQTFLSQSAFAIEPVCFDFLPCSEPNENGKRTYRVFATKQTPLMELLTVIEQAGLKPVVADISGYALNHCWQLAQHSHSVESGLLIDLNGDTCSLMFANQQSVLYANTWAQDDTPQGLAQLYRKLQTLIQRLTVQHNLEIDVIWLCGSLANCPNRVSELRQWLAPEVKLFNPLTLLTEHSTTEVSNGYALAASIAVRACHWQERSRVRVC